MEYAYHHIFPNSPSLMILHSLNNHDALFLKPMHRSVISALVFVLNLHIQLGFGRPCLPQSLHLQSRNRQHATLQYRS